MSKLNRNFRSVAFYTLAVLLGVGAFTSLYAPPAVKRYYSDPYCYYGSYPTTSTSTVSQTDANNMAAARIAESPTTNNFGPCAPNNPPSTPGVP